MFVGAVGIVSEGVFVVALVVAPAAVAPVAVASERARSTAVSPGVDGAACGGRGGEEERDEVLGVEAGAVVL
jgi:hypothetical protein